MTETEIRLLKIQNTKLKNYLFCAVEDICQLCKIINPQHKDCKSCESVDNYKRLLEENL